MIKTKKKRDIDMIQENNSLVLRNEMLIIREDI